MKTLTKATLFLPLLTAALLSGCGTTAVTPQTSSLSAQAAGGRRTPGTHSCGRRHHENR